METKFVKISTPSCKQPEQSLKMHPTCTNFHQIFITNAKKCQKMQLDLCIVYTLEANSGNAELGVKISFSASPLTASVSNTGNTETGFPVFGTL
jgi:hypothetical protein